MPIQKNAAPARLVSLVLPTYNEAANLEKMLSRLTELFAQYQFPYEIIVVDDNSPDETWKIAQRLADERFPNLKVVHRRTERGLATAVIRGWSVASGEILVVMDADGQHPVEVLGELLGQIEAGADIVVASRHTDGGGVSDWSVVRRFLSRGAQFLAMALVPSVTRQVSDPMSGFFALRKSVIEGKTLDPVGYKILLEVLGKGNYSKIGEVGYVFLEREGGESKVTSKQYWEYLQHLFRLSVQVGDLERFLKFGVVGLSGVVVNLAVLWWLKEQISLPLWQAATLAIEAAILNNFIFNDAWTFQSVSRREPGLAARFARLVRFNLICLVGAAINLGCFLLLTQVFKVHYLAAQLIAIGVSILWNYTLNAVLNWRVNSQNSDSQSQSMLVKITTLFRST